MLRSTFELTSFIMRFPPPPARGLRSLGAAATGASSNVRVWLTVMRFALRLNSRTTNSALSSSATDVPSSLVRCFTLHEPSNPYGKAIADWFPSILTTVPECFDPTAKIVSKTSHGFSSSCLCPRLMRRLSLSSSSTTTSMVSPTLQNSDGCLIFFDQLRSEMCTRPSIPSSNSTNKPKLVKFRTVPDCFEFNGYR